MKISAFYNILIFLLVSISSPVLAKSNALEIAEIRGDSKIFQLTSLDWDKESSDSSQACFINAKEHKTVEMVGKPRIESQCMDYTVRDGNLLDVEVVVGQFSRREVYGLLDISGECNGKFIESPKLIKHESAHVIPSYIDLESFKSNFIYSMTQYYLALLGTDIELNEQDRNNLEYIGKNSMPEIDVDIDMYRTKGGVEFHNTRLFFLIKNKAKQDKRLRVADYWYQVRGKKHSLKIYENLTYSTLYTEDGRVGYEESYLTRASLHNKYIGPMIKNGKIYFISASHGYESVWLELHEYFSRYGSEPKVIRKWDYGC